MTDIEKRAQALEMECAAAMGLTTRTIRRDTFSTHEALCRAVEQHEAFRQEVSDAVEYFMDGPVGLGTARERLGRFIIAKPVDPFLIEAREVCARVEEERNNLDWATRYRSGQYDELGWVKHIRSALEARGGRIVWEGE